MNPMLEMNTAGMSLVSDIPRVNKMAEAETVEGDLIVKVQTIPGEGLGIASRTIDSKTRNLEGVQVKPDHSSRAGKVHPTRIGPQLSLKKISSQKRT
jgi:hypothetical protein